MGKFRQKVGAKRSKKMFSHSASHTHVKNMPRRSPMRGGIRL
nr:MAG: hypothetical protein [Microvirus sp.]